MHRKQIFAAAMLAATLALTACSTKTPGSGSAVPSPGQASSPQQPTPSSGGNDGAKAPTVAKPLDGAKFAADPCLSLTQDQMAGFNSSDPGKRNDGVGVACDWRLGADGEALAEVAYNPKLPGLGHLYAQNAAGFYSEGYFEPIELAGYPAVRLDAIDARADGDCGLSVGISDQLFFTVRINGKTGTDGCKATENVAKLVLQNIQRG